MEFFLIYLFVMIEQFAAAFSVGWGIFWISSFLTFCLIGITAGRASDYLESRNFEQIWKDDYFTRMMKRFLKPLIFVGFVMGTIGHFMPTQKQLAIIVGSGVTYNVLTSEPAKQIGGKALELLQKKIDAALKETETNEEKSVEKKDVSL